MAVRRGFGIAYDALSGAGGSSYDDLVAGAIPDATEFWPVTSASLDKNITQLDRNDEVRGRRGANPPNPFRADPVMVATVPAYLSVIARVLSYCLDVESAPVGASPAPITHSLISRGYGADTLTRQVHAQLVRDDLNQKMAGGSVNRVSLTFPFDGEGAAEIELVGLYSKHDPAAAPTPVFSGVSKRPLVIRDASLKLDPVNEVQTVTGASAGTWTLTYRGQTTAAIALAASAAAVQSALEALTTIGNGNVSVAGAGPYVVTFANRLGGENLVMLAATGTGTAVVQTTAGSGKVVDLQGFEWSYNNNLAAKHYAGRNLELSPSSDCDFLWYPELRKVGAMPELTTRFIFGNTDVAQEARVDYRRAQKAVFEIYACPLGTTPEATELLRITQYAAVLTGGGPENLSARDDITSNYEGASFYSDADGKDIQVDIVNARPTSYLVGASL